MKNIFIKTDQNRDYFNISKDPLDWGASILESFYKIMPENIPTDMIRLEFIEENRDAGSAIGTIILETEPIVRYPFIIRTDGDTPSSSPFDVMIVADEGFMPYTQENLFKVMSAPVMFGQLSEEKDSDRSSSILNFLSNRRGQGNASLDEILRPPRAISRGRFKRASEKYPMLSTVCSACHDDIKLEVVNDNKDTYSMLDKDAKDTILNHSMGKNAADIPIRVIQIKKKTLNGFPMKTLDILGNLKKSLITDRAELESILSKFGEKDLSFIYNNDSYINKVREHYADTYNTRKILDVIDEGDIPNDMHIEGYYRVKDLGGNPTSGYLIDEVRDFDNKEAGLKVFVGNEFSGYQDKISAKKVKPTVKDTIHESEVKPGSTGVIVRRVDGKTISTPPFTVKRLEGRVDEPTIVVDMFGRPTTKLIVNDEVKNIVPSPLRKNTYLIPKDTKYYMLKESRALRENDETFDAERKIASTINPSLLRVKDDNNFRLTGKIAKDMSFLEMDMNDLDRDDATFVLCASGISKKACDAVFDYINKKGEILLSDIKRPDYNKIAQECIETSLDIHDFCRDIRKDSMAKCAYELSEILDSIDSKIALDLDKDKTVDEMLALDFVTPENIAVFINAIPEYEKTLAELSKLLIGSRLGVGIDEAPVKITMDKLLEIISKLKTLGVSETAA